MVKKAEYDLLRRAPQSNCALDFPNFYKRLPMPALLTVETPGRSATEITRKIEDVIAKAGAGSMETILAWAWGDRAK